MWFATYDGLNKYDGYNFTVYRHQYKNPRSIASDITRCVVIDEDNRVWIGTRDGLSLYNHRKSEFSNFYYKKREQNVAVMNIVPLQRDWLMLGTAEGILLFDVKGERFLNDTLSTALHMLRPSTLVKQGDCVYIGTEGGGPSHIPPCESLNMHRTEFCDSVPACAIELSIEKKQSSPSLYIFNPL